MIKTIMLVLYILTIVVGECYSQKGFEYNKVLPSSTIMSNSQRLQGETFRYAVVSDYGWGSATTRSSDTLWERQVSNLIRSWNPDLVLTCGDNSHGLGEWEYIDSRIYNFYSDFIAADKFRPALGNHDFYTNLGRPLKTRFPNLFVNGRNYYDFTKSNLHFFVINSEDSSFETQKFYGERDGVKRGSIQWNYFYGKRQQSTSDWNIIYYHHSPFPNLQTQYLDMYKLLRCYGDSLKMDVSYNGHTHEAAATNINGYNWISIGTGGAALNNPALVPRRSGCVFQDYTNHSAMDVHVFGKDSLLHEIKGVDNRILYSFVEYPKLSVLTYLGIEGFYDPTANKTVSDTIKALIRQKNFPYARIDSAQSVMNSDGRVLFRFPKATMGDDYYLVIKHRNSIETWSSGVLRFNSRDNLTYNFTDAQTKAIGNNLYKNGNKYLLYGGDTNQDGIVDSRDINNIYNDIRTFKTGYVVTDLNGDNIVDSSDMNIAYKNSSNFILKITP